MSRTAQRLRAQPLLSFFALTCALSWWTWAIPALHLPIFPPGPFVAAWLVLRFGGERDAALALASSLVRWRVPARALAFVLSAPPLLVALSIGGDVALGAAWPTRVVWLDRSHLLLLFPLLLLVPAAGGAWSEPGFRGYALPRLLERGSPLVATLVLGVVVSVWHLPLVIAGRQPIADLAWIVAWSFLFTHVYRTSRGSIFAAMLLHAWDDTLVNFAKALFSGADLERLGWIHFAVYALAASALVAIAPRGWLGGAPDASGEARSGR